MSSSSLQLLLAPASRLQGWDTAVSVRPCHTAQTSKQTAGLPSLKNRKTNDKDHKEYPFNEWKIFSSYSRYYHLVQLSTSEERILGYYIYSIYFVCVSVKYHGNSVSPDVIGHYDIWINWLSLITVSS